MCGRYAHFKGLDREERAALREGEFSDIGLEWDPSYLFEPRYNVAPGDTASVIRQHDGKGRVGALRWGLIPFWAKDEKIGYRTINARSETAATKPSFREAFVKRRCLVLANGFYEWKPVPGQKWKQPHFIHAPERDLLLFAGLWERWRPRDGRDPLETFTILTTQPNATVAPLHDRMPCIIDPAAYEAWLDPSLDEARAIQAFLHPAPEGLLATYPVTRFVSNANNEGVECIQPDEPLLGLG